MKIVCESRGSESFSVHWFRNQDFLQIFRSVSVYTFVDKHNYLELNPGSNWKPVQLYFELFAIFD